MVPQIETGQAVFIVLTNHAIGDGMSMIGVTLNCLDDSPVDPNLPLKQQRKAMFSTGDKMKSSENDVPKQASLKLQQSEERAKFVVQKRRKKPSIGLPGRIIAFFGGFYEGMFGLFGKHDPQNYFKIKDETIFGPTKKEEKRHLKQATLETLGRFETYQGGKLLAKTAPIDLNEIKELKTHLKGGTVNDILMTVLTMTVKSYLKEVNDPMLKRHGSKALLRGSFPVSMRKSKEPLLKKNNPCNKFQPLSFRFPFDHADPLDCFWKVKRSIDRAKVSPQLLIQDFNARLMFKLLPKRLRLKILHRLATKATAQLSNVPGPQRTVHLLGAKVEEISFYLFAPIGLYMGLMSYNGKVYLTLNMDASLKDHVDPTTMASHWTEQYKKFKEAVQKYPGMVPQSASKRRKVLASLTKS